jgi:multiple sugar transport system permease protein
VSRRRWWKTGLAAAITAAYLFPVYWMVGTSFKLPADVQAVPPKWLPAPATIESYEAMLSHPVLGQALRNSVLVSLGVVALTLLLAAPATYAISRLRMRGASSVVLLLLIAQLLPSIVIAAPLFVILRKIDMTNTLIGLILANTTLTLPFAVIMLRPLMLSVPTELEDAARIDGCGALGVLWRVLVPVIRPGLIAIAAFSFLLGWGEFVFGFTINTDPEVQPATVVLQTFVGQFGTAWGNLMAAATIISLPVVLVFAMFQRFIVSGLTAGSVR